MNILYATTKGWNIGDELIMAGCERIMYDIFGSHNKIIYNKHPQIRLEDGSRLDILDNSYQDNMKDIKLDVCVMAGTPENFTARCDAYYNLCKAHSAKKIFIGLGGEVESMNMLARDVLHGQADFVSVRDVGMKEELQSAINRDVYSLPCPALYSVRQNYNPYKKIVFVPSPPKYLSNMQGIDDYYFNCQSAILDNIIKSFRDYSVEIVCHYASEFYYYSKYDNVKYSYDVKDYTDFYADAAIVVSSRVHGCGLASSLGIPSIGFSKDFRDGTMNGFMSKILSYDDDVVSAIKQIMSDKELSGSILKHKSKTYNQYIKTISEAINDDR